MDTWRDRMKTRLVELKGVVTREQLAEAVGVTVQSLSNWLNGHREPRSLDDWQRLAEALQVTPAWLCFGDTTPAAQPKLEPRHVALLQAYRGLPKEMRAPIRMLIESLWAAHNEKYRAWSHGQEMHNQRRDSKQKEKS